MLALLPACAPSHRRASTPPTPTNARPFRWTRLYPPCRTTRTALTFRCNARNTRTRRAAITSRTKSFKQTTVRLDCTCGGAACRRSAWAVHPHHAPASRARSHPPYFAVTLASAFGPAGGGNEACVQNLRNLWCSFTCGPHQAEMVNITGYGYVLWTKVLLNVYNIDRYTACGVFDSCKGTPTAELVCSLRPEPTLQNAGQRHRARCAWLASPLAIVVPALWLLHTQLTQRCARHARIRARV
ncbi:MAG: hypothetical protein EOO65_00055 [Methanosarcinales archaeon]|nr:MAG: hypothetical protein EOO65_00055 [Methanosarcinales archaeon]